MINKFKNSINIYFKKYWELLVIIFLGLTPLLWYKFPNSLALGHDMGFPIDPIMFFKDRLFLWTDRIGLGSDQTINSAAILIHGLEASIMSLTSNIFLTQKIVFIFWFLLPGLAMYYFVWSIHKDKSQWFVRLSASLFYMFNHFLLQAWFIAERTKISLFVALPLLTGIIIQVIEGKLSTAKGLIFISLVFLFFNGGGGLPLYGGLLLSIVLAFLFFSLLLLRKNRKELKRLIFFAAGIVLSFTVVNFYWILPTFVKTFSSYREALSSVGGISGILAWSFEISKFASILNVIRLQGIPDWYDNPQHPYSQIFLNNPLLILISFLIPVIVFSSLFLVKKAPYLKRYIIFFNILALLGIIFTTGSHPPFGAIYNLFLSLIPGFAIFRSPFYKFAPALWFAYAYLFSFSLYYLTEKSGKFKTILRFSILPLILIYSFPFFTGIFFNWNNPFSTMTKLSSYVTGFGNWANSNLSSNDRILSFPEQNLGWNTAIYKWGYWSTAPVESLLTNRSVITNDKVMTAFEKKLVESIYSSILSGTDDWKKSAEILGINYFLLHDDFYSNAPKFRTDGPDIYRERFAELNLIKSRSFGEWDLYKLPLVKNKISVEKNPILISGPTNMLDYQFLDLSSILGVSGIENGFVFEDNQNKFKNKFKDTTFFKTAIIGSCLFCNNEDKKITLFLPKPTFLPGSIFYPLVKIKEENQNKILSSNINSKVDFLLGTSIKRLAEIKQLIELKRDERTINSTISNLSSSTALLSKTMGDLNKKDSSSRLLILKADGFLEDENRIIGDMKANASSGVFDNLISLSSDIAKVYQDNKIFEYPYPQDNEKIYFFNINYPGDWTILFKNAEGEKLNVNNIILDGQVVNLKGEDLGDYSSFGIKSLSSGIHEVKFTLQETQNLIDKISKPTQFVISPVSSDCRVFEVNSVYPNRIYSLKFDYATERSASSDNGPFVEIQQMRKGETSDSRVQLKANSVFQPYNAKISTSNQTYALKISICPSPGFEESSTIDINNLSLRIFPVPTAVLMSAGTSQTLKPTIAAKQINQTEYKVSVKNAASPYLLTLNNSFDTNWDLKIAGKPFGEHVVSNGFANGWLINKNGDYDLDISYKPQKYYYIGMGLTVFFTISFFVFLLSRRK